MDMMGVELAHDLRMPLQLIFSSAQMLKLSREDPTLDADAYVDILMQSVEHMRRMLDGTLERCGRAVRQELPRPVNADLATCIRQLCLRCRPFAEQAGVHLSCQGNVASLRMALDEDMLCRVLLRRGAGHLACAGGFCRNLRVGRRCGHPAGAPALRISQGRD